MTGEPADQRTHAMKARPMIDLRGLAANQTIEVANAKRQLRVYFNDDLDAMRRYYGWKIDAPVLAIIAA